MPKISSKNQVTLPVGVLAEAGLGPGDPVVVEPVADGELRVRREVLRADTAFGALTGAYPDGYLARLDAEEDAR